MGAENTTQPIRVAVGEKFGFTPTEQEKSGRFGFGFIMTMRLRVEGLGAGYVSLARRESDVLSDLYDFPRGIVVPEGSVDINFKLESNEVTLPKEFGPYVLETGVSVPDDERYNSGEFKGLKLELEAYGKIYESEIGDEVKLYRDDDIELTFNAWKDIESGEDITPVFSGDLDKLASENFRLTFVKSGGE